MFRIGTQELSPRLTKTEVRDFISFDLPEMKRSHTDNIDYLIGWLCGAVFLLTPIVAIVYVLRHRRRPAFQAILICVMSLSCIMGGRALMLSVGVQHKHFVWISINWILFLVVPLVTTAIALVISWPHPSDHTGRHTSKEASQPVQPS